MTVTSLDGRILRANPAFCALLGRPGEEVVGHFAREFTHPDDLALTSLLMTAAGNGRDATIEKRYVLPDGKAVHARIDPVLVDPGLGQEPYLLTRVEDVTQRKHHEAALEHQVFHDPLTGLPARRLLADRLHQSLDQAGNRGARVALMWVDVDDMRDVNESLGYEGGDSVLVQLAARLQAAVGRAGTVGRAGGDEFLVLFYEVADTRHARLLAEGLGEVMRLPIAVGGEDVELSCTIGVAVASPGTTTATVMRDATCAMYQAKLQGRAVVRVFEPSSDGNGGEPLRAKAALKRAMRQGELSLAYQPVVDIATGAIVAAEALLRWHDPERADIGPSDFIPLAEQSGLIGEIGDWVLRRVCQEMPEVMERSGRPLPVAVNLSALQLTLPGFVERVRAILGAAGMDPHLFVFEVTETALNNDSASACRTLQALQDMGALIAVDDFGTGYSSLLSLKRFPVDVLKVDGSFVDGLGEDVNDTVIVEAVVKLAHSLGLAVVAEGVERPAQVEWLQAFGPLYAQGFLFSRPVAAAGLVEQLAAAPAGCPGRRGAVMTRLGRAGRRPPDGQLPRPLGPRP